MKTFIIMNFLKSFCLPVIFLSMIVMPVFYTGCSDSGNTILQPPPPPPPMGGGTIMDIDSNIYPTVNIGNQVWMAANLITTRYNDGTVIPNVSDSAHWFNLTTGAWAYYDNQSHYDTVYGKLYNWHAVNTGKLCPEGWRIPSRADWDVLINYLGGPGIAGGKMKSTGTEYWISPNISATNSSGFSALPGGIRARFVPGTTHTPGNFHNIRIDGRFWTSTRYNDDANIAWTRYLYSFDGGIGITLSIKNDGLSCRCIMN